ncbi:MAG TPA: hypothetical protein VFE42_20295 [Chloroflexota bacterium]|nr:hypothetical protein [Chloroflexota bacterium]
MQQILKFGTSVLTSDRHDVGSLHRTIIDIGGMAVTAIAVERPLLTSGNLLKPGGWTAPRDQRVEMALVTGADDDEIRITPTEDEFLALPPYIVGEVAEQGEAWDLPPQIVAEDLGARASALLGGAYEPLVDEVENRGPDERHLSAETPVWRHEPHTQLGELDRVLYDDETNAVTGLVVRRGLLFHHDVLLPASYIVEVLDDLVHVDLSDEAWQSLEEYVP